MKNFRLAIILSSCVITGMFCFSGYTSQQAIQLVKPDTKGGVPLMEAISRRHSGRSFSSRDLPDNVLSGLLWAAYGINRPDSGKRTAPSAMDKQEILVYAAMKNGLYLYNAKEHRLELVVDRDIRALTGKQGYVKDAPVNLIYVADMKKMAQGSNEEMLIYAGADTGFIGENVYLYCASEGLETVIRAYIDREALSSAMKLKPEYKIILAQSVGYGK